MKTSLYTSAFRSLEGLENFTAQAMRGEAPITKGMKYGAAGFGALGAGYGLISSDGSMLGSGTRGALFGTVAGGAGVFALNKGKGLAGWANNIARNAKGGIQAEMDNAAQMAKDAKKADEAVLKAAMNSPRGNY